MLTLLVACAAVWTLAPEPSSAPAEREERPAPHAHEPRATVTSLERSPPPDGAPVVSSSRTPAPRADVSPPDEDPSAWIESEDWVDLEARRAEEAARPLSARIARWRRDVARPSNGGVLSFEDEPPPTLPPVRGVVRRRADRAPIGRAQVSWSRSPSWSGRSRDEAARTFTDASGRFELGRVDGDGFEVLSCALDVTTPGYALASCFAGVGGELEVWLEEEATVEVTYVDDGTPVPRLEAVGGPPWLQESLDEQGRDDGWSVRGGEDAFAEVGEEDVRRWSSLPPGDYEVVAATTSVRITLRAGETRRLRVDPPARSALTLTVLTPAGQPAGRVDLRLTDERGRRSTVRTDAQGRFEGQALEGAYRVVASLTTAPWQPELGEPVGAAPRFRFHFDEADPPPGPPDLAPPGSREFAPTEVDLGTIPGPGDHRLILPRLARLELTLSAPDELDLLTSVDLLCLEPGHECLVVGDVKDRVARGALHPGRYAVFDPPDLLGEVDLPAARALTITPQDLVVRWRPGVDLDPEQAVRGEAWLSPALLAGRPPPAWSTLPNVWDSADPQGDFHDAQARLFMADAHGRLASDPALARAFGGRMTFYAPGRYVLEGWSDLGPFRVEVDLPAPGGIDVDLSPR